MQSLHKFKQKRWGLTLVLISMLLIIAFGWWWRQTPRVAFHTW